MADQMNQIAAMTAFCQVPKLEQKEIQLFYSQAAWQLAQMVEIWFRIHATYGFSWQVENRKNP
jgi:hypothetical protein